MAKPFSTTTAAAASVRVPAMTLTRSDDLLRFADYSGAVVAQGSWPYSSLHPHNVGYLSGSYYLSGCNDDGIARVKTVTLSTPSSTFLTGGDTALAGTFVSINNGWDDAGKCYYASWTAWGASTFQCYSRTTGGTVTAYGPTVSHTLVNNANEWAYVAGVQYAFDALFVCVVHNNILKGRAVAYYYKVTGTTVTKLDNVVESSYQSDGPNWYQKTNALMRFYAMRIAVGTYSIVAHDGATIWNWTIKNGIESQPYALVPLSKGKLEQRLIPTGMCQMGTLFYITAQLRRIADDGVVKYQEMYLVSADGSNWSVGEWSSFIGANNTLATFPKYYGNVPTADVMAFGRGAIFRASARAIDTGSTATQGVNAIKSVDYSFMSNGADSLGVDFIQRNLDATPFGPGARLNLGLGYGTANKIGEFMVDQTDQGIRAQLHTGHQVQAIDSASWKLQQWHAPTYLHIWSKFYSPEQQVDGGWTMKDFSRLIAKTTIFAGTTASANGLIHDDFNSPLVTYTAGTDYRDGMIRCKLKFGAHNGKALSSFGFLFGGGMYSDYTGNKNGWNALMVPRSNTAWSGAAITAPEVRTFLGSDTETYSWSQGEKGLWKHTDSTKILTSSAGATVTGLAGAHSAAPNATSFYMMRKVGRKIQLWSRGYDMSPSNIAAQGVCQFLGEYTMPNGAPIRWADRDYWGLVVGNDTYTAPAGTSLSESEISAGLTDAAETVGNVALYANNNYTVNRGTASQTGSGTLTGAIFNSTNTRDSNNGFFHVGQLIRISGFSNHHRITALDASGNCTFTPNDVVAGGTYTVYTLNAPTTNDWGYADTGFSMATIGGTSVELNAGAPKTPAEIKGTGIFINENNTAMSIRKLRSDGAKHYLQSGSTFAPTATAPVGGTLVGWDFTNPVPGANGWNFGSNGSGPSPWKLIFKPGYLFEPASWPDLGACGFFKVDDEIIRFGRADSTNNPNFKSMNGTQRNWVEVPYYYFPPHAVAAGATVLRSWRDATNTIQPGNDPGLIGSGSDIFGNITPQGLLVEVISKGSMVTYDVAANLYVASSTYVATPADRFSGSSITLASPYQNEVRGVGAEDCDLVVLSGRGQLNTTSVQHLSTAPVLYYPLDLSPYPTAPLKNLIQVQSWGVYRGLFNTSEEDLTTVCNLAGVRDVRFRSQASYTGTPSTLQTLCQASDFTIHAQTHLHGSNKFSIGIRGTYNLDIWHDQATAEMNAGRQGNVMLSLSAPGSAITPASGEKILERVSVRVTDQNLSGTWAGSQTDNTSKIVNIKVAVKRNLITVEMEDQAVWTFDLDVFENYSYFGSGAVTIQGSYPTIARVPELGDEIEDHIVDMDGTGTDAMGFVTNERHVTSRSTDSGGIEFGRYMTRDSALPLPPNIEMTWSGIGVNVPGHVVVSGAQFGEYIDESWLRQYGYNFAMGQNRLLNTSADSSAEARLLVREGKELTEQTSYACAPICEIQPEDRVYGGLTGFGDMPSHAIDAVVSSGSIQWKNGAFTMSINARKYYDY